MSQSNSLRATSLHTLPDDLKAMIFEYVPVNDYGTLSLVCRDFHSFLQKMPELWAFHLFHEFLYTTPKGNPSYEEKYFNQIALPDEAKLRFFEMPNSQKLLGEHYTIVKQWKSFFGSLLPANDCKSFLGAVFDSLANPNYPNPYLKKDSYQFYTHTTFQNFLTEVHFGINGRSMIHEKKQDVVKDIAKQMKSSLLDRDTDRDDLIATRWYLFNNETRQNGGMVNIDQGYVEEFYWILHNLIKNYCKMVFTYLSAIRDPYTLLTEYTRVWNRFALIILDFSQTFSPFAELFNTLYEDVCSDLPHFPEFSTWRLMVKIWITEVSSGLTYFLGEAFRFILLQIRDHKKVASANNTDTAGNCSSCHGPQVIYNTSNPLYDQFFYKTSQNFTDNDSVETRAKSLKEFCQAVDDISYNEFSVFYWDCNSEDKSTPKGLLNSLVLQDSKVFYEHPKECLWQDANHYRAFLVEDCELISSIFGKYFASEMRQLQSSLIREFLLDTITCAVEETSTNHSDVSVSKNDSSLASTVNLRELLRFLSADEILKEKVLVTKKTRDLITAVLERNGEVLNSYWRYLVKEREETESQMMEFEDTRSNRALRGFLVADKKYNRFFGLVENLSLGEIERVAMEGKDIQEEVELAVEEIVFL